MQESALIWNQTTIINVDAQSVQVQTELIGADIDEIDRQLRQLEQQADEDERLAREVGQPSSPSATDSDRWPKFLNYVKFIRHRGRQSTNENKQAGGRHNMPPPLQVDL